MMTNKFIARAIVSAQIASDAGKGKTRLRIKSDLYPKRTGYRSKIHFQIRALEMIRTSKRSGFNYYVVESPDQNGCPSIIVYFNFNIEGERLQVSFHNPSNNATELMKYVGSGRITRWNKDKITSCESCQKLIDYYGL